MAALTYFTSGLAAYAPLSYGIVGSFGVIIGLYICKSVNNIFAMKYTNKPIFVEYRMEKGPH